MKSHELGSTQKISCTRLWQEANELLAVFQYFWRKTRVTFSSSPAKFIIYAPCWEWNLARMRTRLSAPAGPTLPRGWRRCFGPVVAAAAAVAACWSVCRWGPADTAATDRPPPTFPD